MAIPKSVLEGSADRLAKQTELLRAAIVSSTAEGGGYHYPRIHAGTPSTGLFGTENDLISSANALDTSKITDSSILPSLFRDYINDFNTHASNENFTDFNTMISGLGLNVDPQFDTAWEEVKGSHLWGENVYSDTVITLATMDVSSSGVGVFTAGTALGSGSHQTTSSTNRAAGMLHAVPQGLIGATDIILDIRLTNENDVAVHKNVTISAGTAASTLVSVGTSGIDFYRSVTNIVLAGGTNEQVLIRNQAPERVIAL